MYARPRGNLNRSGSNLCPPACDLALVRTARARVLGSVRAGKLGHVSDALRRYQGAQNMHKAKNLYSDPRAAQPQLNRCRARCWLLWRGTERCRTCGVLGWGGHDSLQCFCWQIKNDTLPRRVPPWHVSALPAAQPHFDVPTSPAQRISCECRKRLPTQPQQIALDGGECCLRPICHDEAPVGA